VCQNDGFEVLDTMEEGEREGGREAVREGTRGGEAAS